jgi:hypothetical protein
MLLQPGGPGRLRGQVPLAAVGRHAAARQHLPRTGPRAQDAAAGRALRRAGRLHARRAVVHPARPAGRAAFNVILVTHDLRESVFLADTVYVMSKSPGRFVVRRDIDLPRPRDLEVTYTPQFTDIVHELRGHIGAMRNAGQNRRPIRGPPATKKHVGTLVALGAAAWPSSLLWQLICSGLQRVRVHLPQPAAIGVQLVEFRGVDRRSTPGAPSGSPWSGFGIAIVVGVLLGFLIGSSSRWPMPPVPADDGLQRPAQGGLRADPGGVVRHRRRGRRS